MAPETNSYWLDGELARLGRTLVAQLFVLFKTSFNYSEGHAALDIPVANVLKVVREIHQKKEEASVRVRGDNLYLGTLRLKPGSAGFESGRFVMEEMKRHFVGRIYFAPEVTAEELHRFVYAFREVDEVQTPDAYARVLERMQRKMVRNIEVEALPEHLETAQIDRAQLKDDRLKARLLYKKAVGAMEQVMTNAAAGQPLRLRECKRVVQHLIDLLPTQEATLLGLTTRRSHDPCSQGHAANVCILTIAMGRRLGLSKFHLCELGMAALLHDLGKAELPREIVERAGELSGDEEQLFEAHPLYGVKIIMELKGLDSMSSRIMTGLFEHHLLADHSGYPRFAYQHAGLFGKLIGLADCYDALTSSPVGGEQLHPPDKALRLMMAQAGKEHDQVLLKLLISCVGIHGIGSLLLLDSRELAVLVENHPDPDHWDKPRVRVIADAAGREIEGETVDLAHAEPPRSIIATLDPHLFDLDVSRYFV